MYIYSNYKLTLPRQDSLEIEASIARINARIDVDVIENQEFNNENLDPIEGNDNDDEGGDEDENNEEVVGESDGEEDWDETETETNVDAEESDEIHSSVQIWMSIRISR